ncbi:hypothetical protein A4X06_0g3818 [Tilletia controversa]|uniref:RNA-directed DNA polymerase n=4 Tax=Tilletia TaxID=13289 RepID=A0A8X7MTQ7_9BASI|nr:hypothetical protein CF336_g7424 [Tilletia laevis]KAE8187025.1 hypothetical protein CF328_g7045 [Tilletia controversa]KAE8188692.1 hypothetical protein CF335_g6827 [Tilletia laevis]KAE8248301.1 hypothetical protein A4X06_0g3818 [Tilletia controversa]KAE8248360.1 hypothetical protein A4X03_0g6801 [Tilletia caries]
MPSSFSDPLSHFTVSGSLILSSQTLTAQCVIDSGALGLFVSPTFIKKNDLDSSLTELDQTLSVEDVAGRPLPPVTHSLQTTLSLSGTQQMSHVEQICFYVADIGNFDIILGLPWLLRHDPHIDWQRHLLLFDRCPSTCKTPQGCTVPCSTTSSSNSSRARCLRPPGVASESLGSAAQADPLISALSSSTISIVSAEAFHQDWLDGISSGALALVLSSGTSDQLPSGASTSALGIAIGSSSAPSHDVDLSKVPPQLHDLAPVFSKSSAQQLPPHRPYDITLPLKPDTVPPRGPLYILSPKELKTLHEWLEEQLRLGLIRPSSSPASSPILFVKKKDGSLRLCVDYRGLNAISIKNRNPLPRIDQLLDSTRRAQFFTKIDLRAAYNLLRVASGEEWKTAFRTHFGLYETLVMPFGLTNAPPVFQAFITDVLRTHIGRYAAVYLEDILIYSNTLDEHWTHVRAVLTDLLSAQLFAKLEKCDFAQPRVEFLGFFIGQGTLEMDPDKLSTIREWPLPTNVKQIQQFLGFCNFYRRFVSRYAHHAGALSALTHKDTPFDIGPSTSAYLSFTSLRNALLSAPLLRSFDPTRPIQLITDASDFALAANLHQPDDDDVQHPVAFFSRQLAPAEKNYTAYDKEMLAIVEGLRQFRHWCHGCASQLTILTDHRNLVYFQQAQRLNDRQARWQEQLAEFHFVIEHLAGAKNPADPPSRRPDYGAASDNNHRLQVLLPPQRLRHPSPSTSPQHIHSSSSSNPLSLQATIFPSSPSSPSSPSNLSSPQATHPPSTSLGPQAVLSFQAPSSELLAQLQELCANDSEFAAAVESQDSRFHQDGDNYLFQQRLFVPQSLRRSIIAQHHDSPAAGHRGHAVTHDLVSRSFDWPGSRRTVRDYVRCCDSCARNKTPRHLPYGQLQPLEVPTRPWQLISMDHAVDLPPSNGFDSIWIVVDHFSGEAHFVPCNKSDDANTLAQQFLVNIFRLHGLPERIISDRGATFISQFWRRLLQLLDVKASPSTAYHPQTNGKSERTIQTLDAYLLVPAAEQLAEHLERTWHEVRAQLRWAKDQMASYYNQHRTPAPQYKTGDRVWLLRRNIPTTRPSDKLDHRRLGPFEISEQIGSSAYRLTLPPQLSSLHPVFPVVLLEPFAGSNSSDAPPAPPTLAPTLDQAWQAVEQIIDQRKIRNRYHYLLRWRDKPASEDTWRSLSDIPVSLEPLLQAFHRRYPRYPVPADLRPTPFNVRHLRDRVLIEPRATPGDVQQFARSVLPDRVLPARARVSQPASSTLRTTISPRQDSAVLSRVPAPSSPVARSSPPALPHPAAPAPAAAAPSTSTASAPFASQPPAQGRVLRSRGRGH